MGTTTRRYDAIEELIESRQWKQAFGLCEKRLKKGDKSDLLQVTRIRCLFAWPDPARQKQGAKELDAILSRATPITEVDALWSIEYGLSRYSDGFPMFSQIWERAANAQPRDKELLSAWYQYKFDKHDWSATQKAAMVWQKQFPKERAPFFLYTLATYLVSTMPRISAFDLAISQKLSYACLSKAAADVPCRKAGEESLNAGRVLDNEADLHLLLSVYKAQGKHAEALSILDDPRTGFVSHVGNHSWEIATQMIELYGRCEEWERQWHTCREILEHAQVIVPCTKTVSDFDFGKLGDDWKAWNGLVTACNELGTDTYLTRTESLIELFSGSNKSRNARLALIKLYSQDTIASMKDGLSLLSACLDYFIQYSTKISCFQDLRGYIARLDRTKQEELLMSTMGHARRLKPQLGASESDKLRWLTSETNALKLEYYLVVSRDDNLENHTILPAFVSNCLRLYRLSLHFDVKLPASDRLPGDDAAVLAAMGLIRMYKKGDRKALLRSVVVLESILSHSKHNYDALLILVRLYMFMGTGSLAMQRYVQLSIKNLQHATLSWVLFTRISTIHPYPATVTINGEQKMSIDPLKEIVHALHWYEEAAGLNAKSVHMLQSKGQWTTSLDALSTQMTLEHSFVRPLLIAEAKRIHRLRFSPKVQDSVDLRYFPARTIDTRDRTAFPDYEALGQLTFEESLPSAGSQVEPNDRWLADELRRAELWDALHGGHLTTSDNSEVRQLRVESRNELAPFTLEETEALNLIFVIDQVFTIYYEDPKKFELHRVSDFIRHFLEWLEVWICKSSDILTSMTKMGMTAGTELQPDLAIPLWSVFHGLFMHLEICQFLVKAMPHIVELNKTQEKIPSVWLTDKFATIREHCNQLAQKVHESATDFRSRVRERAFPSMLVEEILHNDTIGKELDALNVSLGTATKVCTMWQESWIDALDGVLRTKVI